MKTVAHCVTPYLPLTARWIHAQITHLRRYRPVVLTQETQNLDRFPVAALHDAGAWAAPRRWANRLVRKTTGQYPFYGGLLKREGAHLIHAHFGYQGHFCRRARRASGLPMVVSFYGEDGTRYLRYPRWLRRYRRLFDEAEAVLVEGNAMGARLVEAGCPPGKVRVHRLGVDVEATPFRPPQPADEVRLLICASFREKKGIPQALMAVGRALQRHPFPCKVILIGDGPERARVLEARVRSGLGERVRLLGALPYARVLDEMARCHVLLQASLTAEDGDGEGGAPVVLLDAQASGLPVVATRHADIPEYVLDGRSGLLAPEGDVEALAECIGALVEDPGRWPEMGREGRRHVEGSYNAPVQCAALESLYDEYV